MAKDEVESGGWSAPATEEEPKEKPPMKNFWRILGYGSAVDRIMMIVAVLCAAGTGIALPLMNIVFGQMAGDFNNYFIPGTGVTKEQFQAQVNQNVLYIVYLFIGKFVLGYISMFCLRMTGIKISSRLRLAFLQALFKQPIAVFDILPVGKPTTTITTSSNSVQAGISDKIAMLVQSIALVLGAYIVAFRYSWALTLVSTAGLLTMLIIYGFVVPMYVKLQKRIEDADQNASSIAGEVLGSIRTVVASGAEGRVAARYGAWISESRKRGLRLSPIVALQLFPSGFVMYCSFALTFWFGVRQYMSGAITDVGPVVIVVFSLLIVVSSLSFLANPIMAISKAITASTNFFEILDAPAIRLGGLKEPDVSSQQDISFRDVHFSYPSRPGVKVLDGLSLTFPVGKVTALVGPSGCGKSTIVGLLERWYQITNQLDSEEPHPLLVPKSDEKKEEEVEEDDKKDKTDKKNKKDKKDKKDENKEDKENKNEGEDDKESDPPVPPEPNSGAVSVGGHNIDDLDLKWWRSQIGLVQQEPVSFNTSIYTNVSYGLVGSKWENEPEEQKRELVKEACKEAFAAEFIERLPEGYDTVIGENGIKLSGGQRQRVAIARSIIGKPPILILDEATSSIDVRGERIVQEALDRVSQNRTTITIAHRLSTIKKAHKIVVLRKGATVEEGSHGELLQNGGLYHDLVENQQLQMEEDDPDSTVEDDIPDGSPVALSKTLSKTKTPAIQDQDPSADPGSEEGYKDRSLVNSVGLFLWEQRKHWPSYLALLISAAMCGAAFAVQSYLFAQLIQTFQLLGDELRDRSNFWALMLTVLGIGSGTGYFVLGWVCTSVSTKICTAYRQEYFESMLAKPIQFFDRQENSGGSLTARLSTDPSKLQELLGPTMAFPLISVYNICGCIAISFAFGWKLTLVSMFSALPIIVSAMFVRVRYEVNFEKLNAAVFAESSQFASEAISAFRTVTSLTMEDSINDRYSNLLNSHVTAAFHKGKYASLILSLSDSLELPCMALCFWYGGRLLSTYEYDVVQFFVVYIAIVMGGQAAGQFGSVVPNMAQASTAANRILSLRRVLEGAGYGGDNEMNDSEGGARIEFKSVDFEYPTRNLSVFKNLSFTIEKGQFAALVGPSGCGKTTVISLLERFYDYQGGHITIDGTELRSLELDQYRGRLSLVSQEPTLYQGSIRDNILLGVDPKGVTEEQLIQVCRDAEIHDFIISLPDGYNTDVGQRGLALSGGQKQRICIARALIRNPQLLLLDEATSSLDSESEKLVQQAFERTAKGRTVVVVAHRLATVQNADVIFVFGDGGIVEVGNHHSLLRNRGAYFQMCESQALDR